MPKHDRCETFCYDPEKIRRLQNQLTEVPFESFARFFKALGDPTRIKLVFALTVEKELCVCDAAHLLRVTTATASHHLRALYAHGIASRRKEGKMVFYSLKNCQMKSLITAIASLQSKGENKVDAS